MLFGFLVTSPHFTYQQFDLSLSFQFRCLGLQPPLADECVIGCDFGEPNLLKAEELEIPWPYIRCIQMVGQIRLL